jgi:asparagine synthase (glutamine-hydrolysing)
VEHGARPLIDRLNGNVLAVNGEIYNHKELRQQLKRPHEFQTSSDCEILLYLYDESSPREFLNRLNGIFAFVLYDPTRKTFLIARDPIGVNPLYVGWDRQENFVCFRQACVVEDTWIISWGLCRDDERVRASG